MSVSEWDDIISSIVETLDSIRKLQAQQGEVLGLLTARVLALEEGRKHGKV
jgi:hypothetical protein